MKNQGLGRDRASRLPVKDLSLLVRRRSWGVLEIFHWIFVWQLLVLASCKILSVRSSFELKLGILKLQSVMKKNEELKKIS